MKTTMLDYDDTFRFVDPKRIDNVITPSQKSHLKLKYLPFRIRRSLTCKFIGYANDLIPFKIDIA